MSMGGRLELLKFTGTGESSVLYGGFSKEYIYINVSNTAKEGRGHRISSVVNYGKMMEDKAC